MDLTQQHDGEADLKPGTARFWACYAREVEYLDRKPFLPLYGAAFLYALLMAVVSRRPLWFDEIMTYYVAHAPTPAEFFSALAKIDNNPPLYGMLTSLSFRLFGDSDFVTRLPSLIAFWVASVCVYRFAAHRLGRFFGFAAMLTLWTTHFFVYASEARPYAVMIACFGIAMLNWQAAAEGSKRAPIGIALGAAGVLMSHVFGSILLLPLGIAEAARAFREKRIEWRIWASFLAAAPALLFYPPLIRAFRDFGPVYPPAFQGSLLKVLAFYGDILSTGGVFVLAAFAAGVLASADRGRETEERGAGFRFHEIVLYVGLLAIPLAVNLVLMRTGGAFWPRYAIGSGIGVGLCFVHVLAKAARTNRLAAASASAVLLVGVLTTRIDFAALQPESMSMTKSVSLGEISRELPLVDASGLTFLEMNKHEDAGLLSRVYYLRDTEEARRYAHATIFEMLFSALPAWVPIRAHIMPYREFVSHTPRFLVLCTLNYPEDWLVPKLLAEGAEMKLLGEIDRPYKDRQLFEVTLPGR